MRWKAHKNFEERVISKFLLLPREIQGETRWLERTKIRQFWSIYFGLWIDYMWEN